MIIYLGKDTSETLKNEIDSLVSELENIDYQIQNGGQEIYDVLVGVF